MRRDRTSSRTAHGSADELRGPDLSDAMSPPMDGPQVRACFAGAGAWCCAFLVSLVLYAATSAPGVLWGDSGEIQVYVLLDDWLVGGQICRSHVPYFAVTRLAAHLLPLQPARVANLTAALFGAITVANAAWLMSRWCRARAAVIAGSLLLMLAHTLWQMSTSAEVLTLLTALMTAEWMAMLRWVETRRRRWAMGVALVNGLGAATHNMAMLSWPAYAVLGVWLARQHRKGVDPRDGSSQDLKASGKPVFALMIAAAWIAGALPLLILMGSVWLESGSFAATIRSWLFATYAPRVFNVNDLPVLALKSLGYVILNFPTPLVLLAIPGWRALRGRLPTAAWVFLTVHAAALLIFVGRYNVADQYTFFVPVIVLVAMAAAVGVDARLLERSRGAMPIVLLLSLISPFVYAGLPALLKRTWPDCPLLPAADVATRDRFTWFLQPWRAGLDDPERFAREVLRTLPPDVLLVTDTNTLGPINYLQLREGLRRDVRLDLRLARQPWLPPIDQQAQLRDAYLSSGRVYATSDQPRRLPGWLKDRPVRFEPHGPVFRVMADS